jgi:hypothetical protein
MTEAEEQLVRQQQELANAYNDVFTSPKGQLVLAHLAKLNFVLSPTFVAGDPYQTSMHEGQRRVVLSIMKFISVDVGHILKLMEGKHNA